MVARAEKRKHRRLNRRHAGGHRYRLLGTFQQRYPFVEGFYRGVGGAAVSEARLGAGKQRRTFGGGVEHKATGEKQSLLMFVVFSLFLRTANGQRFGM